MPTIYIRTFLDAFRYVSGLPQRPKIDFNELFGLKYDQATKTPISGVSPQGKLSTEQRHKLFSSALFDYRC